ncbi:hypothetical protein RSOL_219910 [Rhizoctonia solani AG-3 Rhs1AP]|uniref:Uncharacterized protein n=1 Tax=Rhizoctonia solani AG-3 Rhs1AP TaxID=1086054 RepID=X8J847_9AGAM|nr:hypothetical protein RSOL_219910 [Rhizoctonia solani AG-3 Rhs1AP]
MCQLGQGTRLYRVSHQPARKQVLRFRAVRRRCGPKDAQRDRRFPGFRGRRKGFARTPPGRLVL